MMERTGRDDVGNVAEKLDSVRQLFVDLAGAVYPQRAIVKANQRHATEKIHAAIMYRVLNDVYLARNVFVDDIGHDCTSLRQLAESELYL